MTNQEACAWVASHRAEFSVVEGLATLTLGAMRATRRVTRLDQDLPALVLELQRRLPSDRTPSPEPAS